MEKKENEETGEKVTIIESCPKCKDKTKEVRICKHFLQKRCKYRDEECRYRHEKEICRYYQSGGCKFGKYCMNIHREATETERKHNKCETVTKEQEECWYFNRRGCKFGRQCRYIHKVEECKNYLEGGCNLGRHCKKVHRSEKKREMDIKKEKEKTENEKREAIKKGKIEKDKEELKCGLCKTTVQHWQQHIKSDRHIKKQLDEFIQETNTSQETIFRLTKAIKKGK